MKNCRPKLNFNSQRLWNRLLVLFLFSFGVQNVFTQTSTYNVFYLNSYNIGYAWSDSISKGVKKALKSDDINLFIECLDAKRFGQEKFELFSDYLLQKYNQVHFDIVITSDNDALDFIIEHRNKLFANIPVVFCGISNPEDYSLEGSQCYGFVESTDPAKTVSILTKIVPEARSLLFVTDNTTSGIIIKGEYERLQKLYPFIKINFISEVDVNEIINTVKQGDKGDFVYLLRINRDKYGNLLDYLDLFEKIASASPKPVFADDEAIVGRGIVGGNANRGFTQGYQSGLLALRMLKDTAHTSIQHINRVKDEYIFDHKQLVKFGINKRLLPPGSVIINKPIEYLKYIFILLIAVIILSAIIVVLVIINRKRLHAERKVFEQLAVINERNLQLEQSYSLLTDLNCELEEANAQLQNLNISLEDAKIKAEESEKLKSSFLANLSHEIRTPLNAILGFSSLLIDPNVNSCAKENFFSIIQSNSDSLLVLIDDILDFSKIEAGQIQIYSKPVFLNHIFEELYTLFKTKSNQNVKLSVSEFALSTKIVLNSDKIRLKQILINLLTNAFKFTEHGSIEFGFDIIGNSEIRFFVKDTGIGIDKKYHKTVFERFRKLEDDKSRLYSGSGLGLAICKKLIELLGGNIWVEGEPGKGSAFYFTHPYFTESNTPAVKNYLRHSVEYNWKGNIIAVAEDEENNYLLLEQILTAQGAEVIRFKDGISIVNFFLGAEESNIKVILMDIKMPGLNGYQAMEKIKKKHPCITIIAQTAYAMSEEIKIMKEKGFDDYITKPINMGILKEKLDKFLLQVNR